MSASGKPLCSLDRVPVVESREWATGGECLHADTVSHELSGLSESVEVRVDVVGEPVLSGDEDHLASGELELGSSEGFLGGRNVLGRGSDGDEDGSDVDTGALAVSLSEGVAHTGLKSISTGAGEHLVDADDVPGVNSDADMESFLTSSSNHVFVGSNTTGF